MNQYRHTHVVPFLTRLERFCGRIIRRCYNHMRQFRPIVSVSFGAGNSGKGFTNEEILAHLLARGIITAIVDMGERFRIEKERFDQWTKVGDPVPINEVEAVVFDELGKLPYNIEVILLIGIPRYDMSQIQITHHALHCFDVDDRHLGIFAHAKLRTLVESGKKRNRGPDDSPGVIVRRYVEWRRQSIRIAREFCKGCHKVFEMNRESVQPEHRREVSDYILGMMNMNEASPKLPKRQQQDASLVPMLAA